MAPKCPACRELLPEDSRFCGFCGFRLAPITLKQESALAALVTPPAPPASEAAPILLTRKKRPSEEPPRRKPQLLVVDELALENTQPAQTQTIPDTEPAPSPRPNLPVAIAPAATGPQRPQTKRPQTKRPTTRPPGGGRRFPRFPLKVEVGFSSEHNFYTGFVQNLSGGGLFVATHTPAVAGQVLEISFSVPGMDRVCTALCLVRWTRDYDPAYPDMIPGMGLQFSQLDPDARAAIEVFIQHREPIFFDDD